MFKSQIRSSLLALASVFVVSLGQAETTTFEENFSSNPWQNGWKTFGDASLFHWNATNQNIEATWNSSKSNSYFYYRLPTILATNDNFTFSFDLRMTDIAIGTSPGKPFTFQFAIGLLNFRDASGPNFFRASGYQAPNLVEFNYFPDSGFGATVSPVMISSNNEYSSGSYGSPFEISPGDLFHVTMNYTATNQTLTTAMTKNGGTFGPIDSVYLATNFSDFRLDALAISSYSEAGQFPGYEGSILAHGTVDNFSVTTPAAPLKNINASLTTNSWTAQFTSITNWTYRLERTSDLNTWTPLNTVAGNGTTLTLTDTNLPPSNAFYRIAVDRP